jgi:diphthine synthase
VIGLLTFIGLGLFDDQDISIKGFNLIKKADVVYAEFYTSMLTGTTIEKLEELYDKKIVFLTREQVEQFPQETILKDAQVKDVVFLSAGDSMISTTHVDLRLRAYDKGIKTHLIHGASITSAVCGLTGLQNYRFGKSATVPFPYTIISKVPYDTIMMNLHNDLHTLLFMDIQNEYMTINKAIRLLLHVEHKKGRDKLANSLAVGVARAGSESPTVKADIMRRLKDYDFGSPLHVLIVPASLHFIEEDSLYKFAGAEYHDRLTRESD